MNPLWKLPSFPSERQLHVNKALSSMTVGVSRGMVWQNKGFSSSHCSWTRWNGSCRGWVGLCAPHLPTHLCKTLDLLQFLLQTAYSESTCAETDMGIFGVKLAQARSKDEGKKPHYAIGWKGWLARCLHVQLVVEVVPYLSVKLNVHNLSCLHQQLAVSYTAVKWIRVVWWHIKGMTRCPLNCLCAIKTSE